MPSKKIVIFASGSGSSVENIILKFERNPKIEVSKIYCNNSKAFLLQRIKKYKVKKLVFNSSDLRTNSILNDLKGENPDLIVLAGFLKKIPENIINAFPKKIINIHPSLLPKYGGKGMFGIAVHKNIISNKDKETGFTIHYVNNEYDEGNIIFQKTIKVNTNQPEQLAKIVLKEEHKYYPEIIKKMFND